MPGYWAAFCSGSLYTAMCTSGRSGYVDQWGWTCGFDPVAQRDPNFFKARSAFVLTDRSLIVPLPQSLKSSDKSVVVPAASRPARKTLDLFGVATSQDDVFGLKGGG